MVVLIINEELKFTLITMSDAKMTLMSSQNKGEKETPLDGMKRYGTLYLNSNWMIALYIRSITLLPNSLIQLPWMKFLKSKEIASPGASMFLLGFQMNLFSDATLV